MKKLMLTLVLFGATALSGGNWIYSACIHDSEADNNGTCYPDVTKNSDGTFTVNSYNCETPRTEEGYPPTHDCVMGEGNDQINPGF